MKIVRHTAGWVWMGVLGLAAAGSAMSWDPPPPAPTTINDFFQAGSQPLEFVSDPVTASVCAFCHGTFDDAPYDRWSNSMMAQAMRDPIFHAALAVANQDATDGGEYCLRCHTPSGWLSGRSTPADGSAVGGPDGEGGYQYPSDFEGVSCSICHRMVDPVYTPGDDPDVDPDVLAGLTSGVPATPGNGSYIFDPLDRRRGPLHLDNDWAPIVGVPEGEPAFFFHDWLQSPFHKQSQLCATCHDVSNPQYSKSPDGSYDPNALDAAHPTGNKHDMFPIERTFSEWLQSSFAQGPVDMQGRYGGARGPAVSSCQDCHMPTTTGTACEPTLMPPVRNDLPLHNFNGANSWVLRAVHELYPAINPITGLTEAGLSDEAVDAAIERNRQMLAAASDLEATIVGTDLHVRVINQTGHKLPTGYGEGRRMWLNVEFYSSADEYLLGHGHYDQVTAELDTASTKVYEIHQGFDADGAAFTGHPEGESFHFILNNAILKDNRIPPRGFTNAGFASVGAQPIDATYVDGQYWDDTTFPIPAGTAYVNVSVYHQTTTREYIEFLRDENRTNDAGQLAYDLWEQHGKSAPVLMDFVHIDLPSCPCDWNHVDGLDSQDYFDFLNDFFNGSADINGMDGTDSQDYFDFLDCFFTGCE